MVHNIAYLRMVEIARSQLAASLGWTLEEMNRTGLVPVVARTEIDYLRPARLGDKLLVTAELARLEKVRMLMSFTIVLAEKPETIFVRCTQTMSRSNCPADVRSGCPQALDGGLPATGSLGRRSKPCAGPSRDGTFPCFPFCLLTLTPYLSSMALDDILLEAEEKMIKSTEVIQTEFGGIRTGKASPDLVTNLMVEAYGTHMRLKKWPPLPPLTRVSS